MKSKIFVGLCLSIECIHNQKEKCLLDDVCINSMAMCDSYRPANIPKEMIEECKKETRGLLKKH